MNNETCIHGGVSPISLLADLHYNQGGSGRHRCPTCAYEEGFILGSSNRWDSYADYCKSIVNPEKCPQGIIAPSMILRILGENQGGVGRHRCTICAFKRGFEVAALDGNANDFNLDLFIAPSVNLPKKKNNFTGTKNIDYISRELKNKRLGFLGELIVLQFEKKYLKDNNRSDLAEMVEHSSVDKGDGMGYDILSFNLQGVRRFIEVKTSRGDISRPFYLTSNEMEFSKRNKNNYTLYRLFDFETKLNRAKCYTLQGDLNTKLNLEPTLYLAMPH